MMRREASINDVAIDHDQRRIFGARTEDEYGKDLPLH
jgi:nuclear transport factor 2 (NTF2) superfamily protein